MARGGARKGAGRKKGIGITYDIQRYCQNFIEEMLQDEAIKARSIKQLSIKYQYEESDKYIYILKGEDSYKIGYTTDFDKRIKHYKTHNPNIKTICLIESNDAFELESYLHDKFEDKNISGEWFDLTEEEVLWAIQYLYNTVYGW